MRVIFPLLISIGLASLLAPPLSAQSADSQFNQQIEALSCSYTTVETGQGVIHDTTCPTFAPTIAEIDINQGKPIITGVYDAVHTLLFRVRFGGIWYTLDSSAELTADGNVWRLNLSNLENPLEAGEYNILAEAKDATGTVLRAEDGLIITPKIIDEDSTDNPPVIIPLPDDIEDDLVVTPEAPQPEQPPMQNPAEVVARAPLTPWIVGGIVLFLSALIVAARRFAKAPKVG